MIPDGAVLEEGGVDVVAQRKQAKEAEHVSPNVARLIVNPEDT